MDTTDRYVANIILGILDSEELRVKRKYCLLNTAVLGKVAAPLHDFSMIPSRF